MSTCPVCNGLGYTSKTSYGRIRCWNCAGNGWDPLENFRWSKKKVITTYCLHWLSYEDNLQHVRVLDLEHEIEAWQLACEALTGVAQGTLLGLTIEELKELTTDIGVIDVTEAKSGDTEAED